MHRGWNRSCVGALEMVGSLLLFILAADSVQPGTIDVQIPLRTDNAGNAYSASKRSSKKWPYSALLGTVSSRTPDGHLPKSHVKRCSNTWADQLTHLDFAGFNPALRQDVSAFWNPQWVLLDRLRELKIQEG